MAQKIKKMSKKFIAFVCMITLVFSYSVITTETDAAAVTSSKDTLSDSRPSTVSNHTITFTTPSGATAGDTITVTFDTAFDTSSIVFGDIDLTDDGGDLTLAGDCSTATDISAVMASDVLTFTLCGSAAAIDAGSILEIEIGTNATSGTNQIANPALLGCSGGSSVCDVSVAGTFGDTGTVQVVLIDGIAVSATVDEYLTFTSNDYVVGFGSWSAGSTVERWATSDAAGATSEPVGVTDPFQLSVSSNGGGGVSITVKSIGDGSSAGLYKSTATTKLIPALASSAVAADTEGYGVSASAASGLTIDEGFDDDTTSDLAVSATNQVFATAAGAVSGGTVDCELNAAIAATTPTGSYADTLVFVCTPTF